MLDTNLSFLEGLDGHPHHLLLFNANALLLSGLIINRFFGLLKDSDYFWAAFGNLLGNDAHVQISVFRLVFVAEIDDFPLLETVPSASGWGNILFYVAVRQVDVVGAVVSYAAIGTD